MVQNTSALCPKCHGLGIRLVLRSGEQFAAECSCRIEKKAELRLQRARIPQRYTHCSLESFDTGFHEADPSLGVALMTTRRFADGYPLETAGQGLLLTGSIGCGKTHLAVGLLRELIEQRGATGIFCDYRDLLKQIQNSYNPQVATTELEILRPIFEAEILLLDELGAVKPTDWVWDTVALILNTRYNDKRTTLITTNYPNQPSALLQPPSTSVTDRDVSRSAPANAATRAMREETLGDRIGETVRRARFL
jgi:DNA replication protein DnaC